MNQPSLALQSNIIQPKYTPQALPATPQAHHQALLARRPGRRHICAVERKVRRHRDTVVALACKQRRRRDECDAHSGRGEASIQRLVEGSVGSAEVVGRAGDNSYFLGDGGGG